MSVAMPIKSFETTALRPCEVHKPRSYTTNRKTLNREIGKVGKVVLVSLKISKIDDLSLGGSMQSKLVGILAVLLLSATQARADFMPPNNLDQEDNVAFSQGLTEEEFNAVIDQAEAVFTPIVAQHKGKLKIKRKWTTKTVNASANRFLKTWYVNMYGGLARRPEITRDGFATVLCHEIGHHLAGFPFRIATMWGATEGQSDYHASLACTRLLWEDQLEENATYRNTVDALAKDKCDERFDSEAEQNLCYRQMMAGFSTASLLAALGKDTISFETKDPKEVKRTDGNHPAAQCRLDTYVAAALCKAPHDYMKVPKTEADSNTMACVPSQGDLEAVRPRCWYAPKLEG